MVPPCLERFRNPFGSFPLWSAQIAPASLIAVTGASRPSLLHLAPSSRQQEYNFFVVRWAAPGRYHLQHPCKKGFSQAFLSLRQSAVQRPHHCFFHLELLYHKPSSLSSIPPFGSILEKYLPLLYNSYRQPKFTSD